MRTRILIILAMFIANILFLGFRLFDLQIIKKDEMLQRAVNQRTYGAVVNNLRGKIYDRNMIPLTDNDEKTCIVIMPQFITGIEGAARVVSANLNIDYESILKSLKLKKPFEYITTQQTAEQIKNLLGEGIVIAKTTSRYGATTVARHVIGYINNDNIGQYGIEKGYDSYLKRDSSQVVGILTDSLKRPLNFGYKAINTFSKLEGANVKLTIDYHFQSLIEKSFDKYGYNGACVLLDTQNGDVLAMVSRPNYEQNDVFRYMYSSNKELYNKALYPYNLGSIFKIVVAAAGFEQGTVNENDMFFCPGFVNVDGQIKKCTSFNTGGHGTISFSDAFAVSCNSAFIELGLRLGYKNIIEYARKFGLGQSIGFDVYGFTEDPGLIQYKSYSSNREIANLSIGQGEILATPLQVAGLINIVANNGLKKQINIVDSIVDDNGVIIKKVKTEGSTEVLPKNNIQKIKKMMNKVLKDGTGTKANIDEFGGGGGKTSSAETGIYNQTEQIIHAWFGGYFPENNPRYAMAIIIENGKTGSQVAAPLFREIVEGISNMGK